eukprot:2858759-Amphidinium_carterae.1
MVVQPSEAHFATLKSAIPHVHHCGKVVEQTLLFKLKNGMLRRLVELPTSYNCVSRQPKGCKDLGLLSRKTPHVNHPPKSSTQIFTGAKKRAKFLVVATLSGDLQLAIGWGVFDSSLSRFEGGEGTEFGCRRFLCNQEFSRMPVHVMHFAGPDYKPWKYSSKTAFAWLDDGPGPPQLSLSEL